LAARIHLCGRVVATIAGRRIDPDLPGRQGRLVFAYLTVHRHRPASRGELVEALWADTAPAAADSALNSLVSKIRRVVGPEHVEGRHELRLALPDDAWVDVEAATAAIHRAEAARARGDHHDAWVASRIAQHIAARPFLAGDDAPWIGELRRDLEGTYLHALEIAAGASLGIGGSELDTAERTARLLVRQAPFRESGYRLLMEALRRRDNVAEALQVYDQLRMLLRDELGTAPSAATQELHRRLLA
jgi:DNA-binding SARP family transcriptional activator